MALTSFGAAEHANCVLDKGYRIRVEGTLFQNNWEKDGEKFSRLELTASDITLDLSRIESVTQCDRQLGVGDPQLDSFDVAARNDEKACGNDC